MKILILLTLLFSLTYAGEKDRSGVAVLNFKSDDLSEVQKASLAGVLSNSLRRNRSYNIITWEEVTRILENSRNRMLLDCDDTQCVDAIAGALNVQYLISGDVSKFGDLWMVNVRFIDSWGARTVRSASRMVDRIEDMARSMPDIAMELLEDETPSVSPISGSAISAVEKTFPLTVVSQDGGRIVQEPQKDSYLKGETVTIVAKADEGYKFAGWEGAISGDNPRTSLVITSEKNVGARFTPLQYPLSVFGENGRVTISPQRDLYNHGENVELLARPNRGYTFSGWSGDVEGPSERITLLMDGKKAVTAGFIEPPAAVKKRRRGPLIVLGTGLIGGGAYFLISSLSSDDGPGSGTVEVVLPRD